MSIKARVRRLERSKTSNQQFIVMTYVGYGELWHFRAPEGDPSLPCIIRQQDESEKAFIARAESEAAERMKAIRHEGPIVLSVHDLGDNLPDWPIDVSKWKCAHPIAVDM